MDYVLWEIGYSNLVMLLATIPVYNKDDEEEKKTEIIDFGDNIGGLADFINKQK